MTPKQIQAARTNGARSKGPVTDAGKKNSARNSIRHGLLAETVVLEEESTERFLDLLTEFMDEHQPSTATQVTLVETMAVARWRQLRVWGAQKTAIDRDMALQDPAVGPATVRILTALRGSPECLCPPEVLLRYEVAFDRQFSRALVRLLALQAHQTNQPPQPYHPKSPSGQTWKGENTPTAERTPETVENVAQADTSTTSPVTPHLPETKTSDVGRVANPRPIANRPPDASWKDPIFSKSCRRQAVENRPQTAMVCAQHTRFHLHCRQPVLT